MVLRRVIFWESDDKKVGMIIQLMHHAFVYGMVVWYLYLHTISDSYLQYVLFCFIFFLVWIQHLFCQACLFFNIEQKLIGDHPNIIDNILKNPDINFIKVLSDNIKTKQKPNRVFISRTLGERRPSNNEYTIYKRNSYK